MRIHKEKARGVQASGLPNKRFSKDAHHNCSAVDRLLPRLDKLKETGAGTWMASCPAHDDRRPSLSIKQVDDRVLVHCFAGCDASDVTAAVGLSLSDLFDEPLAHHRTPLSEARRMRYSQAAEALRALRDEVFVVVLAADRLAAGHGLSSNDLTRLHQAHGRIMPAADIAAGGAQ